MTYFPGAPRDAEYTEEGWLVVRDEAWTIEDWYLLTVRQRRTLTGDVPLIDESPRDEQLRRKRWRDRLRRDRSAA